MTKFQSIFYKTFPGQRCPRTGAWSSSHGNLSFWSWSRSQRWAWRWSWRIPPRRSWRGCWSCPRRSRLSRATWREGRSVATDPPFSQNWASIGLSFVTQLPLTFPGVISERRYLCSVAFCGNKLLLSFEANQVFQPSFLASSVSIARHTAAATPI